MHTTAGAERVDLFVNAAHCATSSPRVAIHIATFDLYGVQWLRVGP